MVYKFYLRFCASINYFFERKMGYDDPGIFALLFVVVLQTVYSFGIFYCIELIIGGKINIPAWFFYGLFLFWAVLNYFFAFAKEQLYKYYKEKFNTWQAVTIILVGYLMMGIAGYYSRML